VRVLLGLSAGERNAPADDLRGGAPPVATESRRTRDERPRRPSALDARLDSAARVGAAPTPKRSARGRARPGAGRPRRGGRRRRRGSLFAGHASHWLAAIDRRDRPPRPTPAISDRYRPPLPLPTAAADRRLPTVAEAAISAARSKRRAQSRVASFVWRLSDRHWSWLAGVPTGLQGRYPTWGHRDGALGRGPAYDLCATDY